MEINFLQWDSLLVHFAAENAGLIGLALTYAVSLNGMFQYCVRQSAEVENLVSDAFA